MIRDRDIAREHRLVNVAAESADLHRIGAELNAYADQRALPGGVRTLADWDDETAQELADARNYLVWGIEQVYEAANAGDEEASRDYERRMRALVAVVRAYYELTTPAK